MPVLSDVQGLLELSLTAVVSPQEEGRLNFAVSRGAPAILWAVPMSAVVQLGCASHLCSPLQRQASPPVQRRGSPTGDEESTELAYLIAALDGLPAPVAYAIGQHVSRVNDGMAKGRAERRGLAKAVHELQQQLMVIPRLEVKVQQRPSCQLHPAGSRQEEASACDELCIAGCHSSISSPAHMPHPNPSLV